MRRGKVYSADITPPLLKGAGGIYERTQRKKGIDKRTIKGYSTNILAEDFADLQNIEKKALLTAGNSENLSFLPSQSVDAVITDPPYFDNVMYSELADFFYVCLRLGLKEQYEYFQPELSCRPEEIVQNEKSGKDVNFFAKGLTNVFKECHRVLKDDGLMLFTFHHNKLWAWENLTNVLLDSDFYVSSAPIVRSEGKSGYHSQIGNVKYDACLVCRKRQSTYRKVCHWDMLKNHIRQRTIHWVNRIIETEMDLNEVDILVIVMGKFLESFTYYYPNITDDSKTLDIHPAVHEMPSIINELACEVTNMKNRHQGRRKPVQLTLLKSQFPNVTEENGGKIR
jgi:adenine-specific DNA methylase